MAESEDRAGGLLHDALAQISPHQKRADQRATVVENLARGSENADENVDEGNVRRFCRPRPF